MSEFVFYPTDNLTVDKRQVMIHHDESTKDHVWGNFLFGHFSSFEDIYFGNSWMTCVSRYIVTQPGIK